MTDTDARERSALILGVEDPRLVDPLMRWGYGVAEIASREVVAVVAASAEAAIAARARGLPLVLDATVDDAEVVLEAVGAPGCAFATEADLRRCLAAFERRGWKTSEPSLTVFELVGRLKELRLWIRALRTADIAARHAHDEATEGTRRHIDALERERSALEHHRDVLLVRVEELSAAHDAVAARLSAIEASRAWRAAATVRRLRGRLVRGGRPR